MEKRSLVEFGDAGKVNDGGGGVGGGHATFGTPTPAQAVGSPAGTPAIGVSGAMNATSRPGVKSQAPGRPEADPYRAALHGEFVRENGSYQAALNSRYQFDAWRKANPDATPDQIRHAYQGVPALNPGDMHEAIGRLQQYDAGKAAAAHDDPNSKVGLLKAIMDDPSSRTACLASNGQPDPGPVPGAGGKPIDANSYGTALAQPGRESLAALLDPDNSETNGLSLRDRLEKAAHFDGMGDPHSVNHQLVQQWFNDRYSGSNADQWVNDTTVPPDPQGNWFRRNMGFIDRPMGVAASVIGKMDPTGITGDAPLDIGFGWHKTYDDRKRGLELLRSLNILPPPSGAEMPLVYKP